MPPQFNPLQLEAPHRHAFLIVLAVLLILTGIFGVWYFSNPLPEEADSSTSLTTIKFADWRTYKNEEYGFEFKYPKEWSDAKRKLEIGNFFTKPPQINVLQIELVKDENDVLVTDPAYRELKKNNCPGDKVISDNSKGMLYVLYCSASSENYIFLTPMPHSMYSLKFIYHDDFEDNWTENQKISKLNQILSTFKFISTSTPTNDENILFDQTSENTCGLQPPITCESGKRLGCNLVDKKWSCYKFK